MRKSIILLGILIGVTSASHAAGFLKSRWDQKLMVGFGMGVFSPSGDDSDLFQTSMGWGLNAYYWFKPRTQIVLSTYYGTLDAREDEWYVQLEDEIPEGETFDEWDVAGKMWYLSAEIRALYPASLRNYLYFGLGADLFLFDTIEGNYAIYGLSQPVEDTISDEREPSITGGPHLAPGMFFMFKSPVGQMFIDVGVRMHYIMDGDNDNPLWIDPYFTMGVRLF
jgi:hypothetical protein